MPIIVDNIVRTTSSHNHLWRMIFVNIIQNK